MELVNIVNAVSPSFDSIMYEIGELKKDNPYLSKEQLSNLYGNQLRTKYTSIGIVSSLPSVIPGIGTGVQIAVEVGTISGDLALMLRWMAANCYGISLIYGKDIRSEFSKEFVIILGIWCGVIQAAKTATTKIATKVAVVQFNKNISGKILQKINQRVGTTILTKYGTKRGGIALGKLIPFGIGAAVAGTFNYHTMNRFKKAAIKYYGNNGTTEFILVEKS